MKSTAQKLILISFVLALIAAVTVLLYLKSLKPSKEINKNTTILVAAETIPPRTLIDNNMIKEIQVPDNSIFEDYIKDHSEIIGKYAKESILKNEGFHADKLQDNGETELALKIESNHRAISISVTGDTGVSDLLKPGDYVDIITYIAEKKDGQKVVMPDTAKIILQNIKLLAVDKQINREDKVDDIANAEEKTITNFLVTLSIKVEEVEKLVLAQSIGTIKLALRPLKDDGRIETKGAIGEELSISVKGNNEISSNEKNSSSNVSSVSNGSEKYTSYRVNSGDTLKKISIKFYGDKEKYTIIKEANNIHNENLILNGQILKIPILQ